MEFSWKVNALSVILSVYSLSHIAAGNSCSKLGALTECSADFVNYIEAGTNVTMVFNFYKTQPSFHLQLCGNVDAAQTCMDNKLQNCDTVTDADKYVVRYFEGSSRWLKNLCNDERSKQEFLDIQNCINKDGVHAEGIACDEADESTHGRQRRHTCTDYENEVRCANAVVSKHCSREVVRKFDTMIRGALTNTPHTRTCIGSSNDAVNYVNSVQSTMILMLLSILAARRYTLLH